MYLTYFTCRRASRITHVRVQRTSPYPRTRSHIGSVSSVPCVARDPPRPASSRPWRPSTREGTWPPHCPLSAGALHRAASPVRADTLVSDPRAGTHVVPCTAPQRPRDGSQAGPEERPELRRGRQANSGPPECARVCPGPGERDSSRATPRGPLTPEQSPLCPAPFCSHFCGCQALSNEAPITVSVGFM